MHRRSSNEHPTPALWKGPCEEQRSRLSLYNIMSSDTEAEVQNKGTQQEMATAVLATLFSNTHSARPGLSFWVALDQLSRPLCLTGISQEQLEKVLKIHYLLGWCRGIGPSHPGYPLGFCQWNSHGLLARFLSWDVSETCTDTIPCSPHSFPGPPGIGLPWMVGIIFLSTRLQ